MMDATDELVGFSRRAATMLTTALAGSWLMMMFALSDGAPSVSEWTAVLIGAAAAVVSVRQLAAGVVTGGSLDARGSFMLGGVRVILLSAVVGAIAGGIVWWLTGIATPAAAHADPSAANAGLHIVLAIFLGVASPLVLIAIAGLLLGVLVRRRLLFIPRHRA
jgi:hypothetical protein